MSCSRHAFWMCIRHCVVCRTAKKKLQCARVCYPKLQDAVTFFFFLLKAEMCDKLVYSETLWCCRDALSCKIFFSRFKRACLFGRDLDKCRIIGTLREKHLGDKNEHFQVTTWLSRSIVQRLCPHRRSPESESDLRPFVGRHLSLILCHSPAVQSNKANKKQKRERSFPLNQDSYRTCHICQNTSIS